MMIQNIIKDILADWKKLLKINLLVLFLSIICSLILPKKYTSETSIYLLRDNDPSNLRARLSSSFLGFSDANIIFFDLRDLATSNMLRNNLAQRTWDIDGQQMTLAEYWEIEKINNNIFGSTEKTDEEVIYSVNRKLKGMISFDYAISSGLFSISVEEKDPFLAFQICDAMSKIIHEYSDTINQKRASHELEYIKNKFKIISDELDLTEQKLKEFLENNKNFQSSPTLVFEKSKLEREILFLEQSYLNVLANKEDKEFSINKQNFIVADLDKPNIPIKPSSPNSLVILIFFFFIVNGNYFYKKYKSEILRFISSNDSFAR